MDRCSIMSAPFMVFMLMLGTTVNVMVDAQALPSCSNQLLPCLDYLNSTNPPDICCNPIKDIDATQKTCFCKLASSPDLLESFGVNVSQAFRVLDSCGVNFDASFCKASSSALPPSSVQPPATPGGDEGRSGTITFTGLSFVLFIWAYVFFN